MSRARTVIFALLGFCGAYTIGRWTVDAPASPPATRVIERDHERTIVQHAPANLDLAEIRAIVRDELAATRDEGSTLEVNPPIDEARLARASEALEQGMIDGRWTADDRDRIRPLFRTLSQPEAERIVSRLFPALNSGALRLDAQGPPL